MMEKHHLMHNKTWKNPRNEIDQYNQKPLSLRSCANGSENLSITLSDLGKKRTMEEYMNSTSGVAPLRTSSFKSMRCVDSSSSLGTSVCSQLSQSTRPEADDAASCESMSSQLTESERRSLEYVTTTITKCLLDDEFEKEVDSLALSMAMSHYHRVHSNEDLNSLDLNHAMGIARQRTERSNEFLQEIVVKTINLVEFRESISDDSSCASAPAVCQQSEAKLMKGKQLLNRLQPHITVPKRSDKGCGSSALSPKPEVKSFVTRVHTMPSLQKPQMIFGSASATICTKATDNTAVTHVATDPHSLLISMMKSHGLLPGQTKKICSLSMTNYFLEPTPEQVAAYDNTTTLAVRSENLAALQDLHAKGKQLQCCNRFGESILHIACRRGSIPMVQFLLDDAKVSIRVRDDFGRTPLHDACWTRDPAFELVRLLIQRNPDLLFFSDKRGHTPLQYVRRDDWKSWCKFLNEFAVNDLVPSKNLINLMTCKKEI